MTAFFSSLLMSNSVVLKNKPGSYVADYVGGRMTNEGSRRKHHSPKIRAMSKIIKLTHEITDG